jgi:hypothetical protein
MSNNDEDHKSNCGKNQPPTKKENDIVEQTTTSNNKEQLTRTMKLIVRSPYWGRVLKGKKRCDQGRPDRPYRVVSAQAVLSNEGQYWGCCPDEGKRVLELKEHHFTDHHAHDWDLYMVGSSVTPNNIYHSFFLLPQSQVAIDINRQMRINGWKFVGSVSSSMLRMELGGLLHPLLKQNEDYGFRLHHVHMDIVMDQIFDRETPRTRKSQAEERTAERRAKIRSERAKMEKAPPIPHVISNTASWGTETTHSSSITSAGLFENWNESFHPHVSNHWNAGYPAPEYYAMNSYWYPTAAMPPPPPMMMLPPMPSTAQQVLQSYSMPPNHMPQVAAAFIPPHFGAGDPGAWMLSHHHPHDAQQTMPCSDCCSHHHA